MVFGAVPAPLQAGDVNSRLKQLVGFWYDTDLKKATNSAYELTLNEDGDGFDVCTYRDSGRIIHSTNLIRLDWQTEESACLTWGRRGGDHVFVAIEVNSSSIFWVRGTTEFRWQRDASGRWAEEDAKEWMQEAKTNPRENDACRGRGRRRYAQSCRKVSMSPPARSRSRGKAWAEDHAVYTSRLKKTSWVTQFASSLLLRAKAHLEGELRGSTTASTRTSTASTAATCSFEKEPVHFYEALLETPRTAADPFYESLMETPRAKRAASTLQAQKRMRSTSVPVLAPIPARVRKEKTRVSTSGKPARVSTSGKAARASSIGKPARVSSSGKPVSPKLSATPRNALDAGGVIRVANYEDYSDYEYEYEYSDEETYSDCTSDGESIAPAKRIGGNRKGWEWPMTTDERRKAIKKHTKNIVEFNPQVLFDEISKLEENLRGKKMSVAELEDCTEKINGLQMMLEQHETAATGKRRVSCKF